MVGQAWASLKLPELQFGKEKMNYMKESAHGCIAVYSMKAVYSHVHTQTMLKSSLSQPEACVGPYAL